MGHHICCFEEETTSPSTFQTCLFLRFTRTLARDALVQELRRFPGIILKTCYIVLYNVLSAHIRNLLLFIVSWLPDTVITLIRSSARSLVAWLGLVVPFQRRSPSVQPLNDYRCKSQLRAYYKQENIYIIFLLSKLFSRQNLFTHFE